ncbi:MAG: hypothetical protein JKY20_12635 [Alphaproteobacteria bacterium]|nr:hypothetical protein [Alphaproteobacteria bacterium]
MHVTGLKSILVLGFFAVSAVSPVVAKVSCAEIAAHHIDRFFESRMEIESATSQSINPCTGKLEQAAIESNPGEGTLLFFDSGDVRANLDRFQAFLCFDGRAYVRNLVKKQDICDTR